MKNFIFISPNFPENYWQFCNELKNNGLNVLGIGDCPYDELSYELKTSLNEYYYVPTLENYDEVYRAVAYFSFRYGKIDYLESNNEYWLEQDARLRTDFNIGSGFKIEDMRLVKFKSAMKEGYRRAGVRTAAYHIVDDLDGCKWFIGEHGYPVVVKPDNGVGASDTHKIKNEEELLDFFKNKLPISYIMEEYVDGEICSYDAVVNAEGEPMFETGNVTPHSIMDIVNDNENCFFYIQNELAYDVREAGRRTLKAFGVKSRFVHFEFFRLLRDQPMGAKGDVVALEVNMRPSGGVSPDMMNYANSVNVYKIWADMIAFDKTEIKTGERFYCSFVGRRDNKKYRFSDEDVVGMYSQNIKVMQRVPDAFSAAMGNVMFLATFKTKEEMASYVSIVCTEE